MEAEHKARCANYVTYTTAEREAQQFILAVVKDTWVKELKSSSTFYTRVTAKELLDHLQETCTRLHALDVLALQNEMQTYHVDAEGILEYVNMLEDAQKRSRRARNPITDASLVVIATNVMLGSEQFPRANDNWEELNPHEQTWAAWKKLYKKADRRAKTKKQAAESRG